TRSSARCSSSTSARRSCTAPWPPPRGSRWTPRSWLTWTARARPCPRRKSSSRSAGWSWASSSRAEPRRPSPPAWSLRSRGLGPPCGLVVTSADMVVLTAAESAIRRSRDDQIGRGGADGASARPDLFACGWSSTSSTGAVSSDRAGPTAGDARCLTLPKPGHPFVGSAAMSTGHLSAHRLRSAHRRLFPDVYVASGAPVEPITLLRGAALWAPPGSVLGGLAAALLHRERWYAPEAVARLIDVYAVGTPPAPAGVRLRRLRTPLPADQVVTRAGVRVTSAARTAIDVARWEDDDDTAIAKIDAICNRSGVE